MAIARNARKSARPSRKVNENRQPPMDTTVVVDKAYRFTGPESYHSIIGQVMAYMGYVGGHEDSQVAARVGLDDSDGRIRLWCGFFQPAGPSIRKLSYAARATGQRMRSCACCIGMPGIQAKSPATGGRLQVSGRRSWSIICSTRAWILPRQQPACIHVIM